MKAELIIDFRSGKAIVTCTQTPIGAIIIEWLKSKTRTFFKHK
jgi:hypothetical protein